MRFRARVFFKEREITNPIAKGAIVVVALVAIGIVIVVVMAIVYIAVSFVMVILGFLLLMIPVIIVGHFVLRFFGRRGFIKSKDGQLSVTVSSRALEKV